MKSFQKTILEIIEPLEPRDILDLPCGNGWLAKSLKFNAEVDGIDLYDSKPENYRNFQRIDLDKGLPENLMSYDAIVSCEGIEHLGNPLLFLEDAYKHLNKEGMLIITTPNIWYPASKLKYLFRGFFPSFPSLIGKIEKGSHMHIMPWSFSSIYVFLKLAGFKYIKIHDVHEKKPRHFFEMFFGWPQKKYCMRKIRLSKSEEEKEFWKNAGSIQSLYGRHLVVSAIKDKQ